MLVSDQSLRVKGIKTYPQHLSQSTNGESFNPLKHELAVPSSPLLQLLVLCPRTNWNLDSPLIDTNKTSISNGISRFISVEERLAYSRSNLFKNVDPDSEWGAFLKTTVVGLCDAPKLDMFNIATGFDMSRPNASVYFQKKYSLAGV